MNEKEILDKINAINLNKKYQLKNIDEIDENIKENKKLTDENNNQKTQIKFKTNDGTYNFQDFSKKYLTGSNLNSDPLRIIKRKNLYDKKSDQILLNLYQVIDLQNNYFQKK